MQLEPATYREGCGTYMGLRLHQVNGEESCSECLRGEAIRRLELESIPTRPSRPSPYSAATAEVAASRAMSPEQGAANYRALAAARGFEDDYEQVAS